MTDFSKHGNAAKSPKQGQSDGRGISGTAKGSASKNKRRGDCKFPGKGSNNKSPAPGGKSKGKQDMTTIARPADPNRVAPNLSASVMGMKFMKRKTDTSVEAEEEAAKRRRLLDNVSSEKQTTPGKGDSSSAAASDNGDNAMDVEEAADADVYSSASSPAPADSDVQSSSTMSDMLALNASQCAAAQSAVQAYDPNGNEDDCDDSSSNLQLKCTYEKTSLYAALPGRRSFGGFNKVVEKHYCSVMEAHVQRGKYSAARDERKEGEADKDKELLALAAMSEPALPGRALKKKPKGKPSGRKL